MTKVYSYGLDLISQRQQPSGTVSYYGYDGLGSVKFLTDATGTVSDTYTYDAYGILLTSTSPTANNYRYAGEQWDPDLGLYYLRARYYQPAIGRFWSMDTEEGYPQDPIALHKYLYVSDNPSNGADPSGHDGLIETLNTLTLEAYVRTMVFTATRPLLARSAGLVVGLFVASEFDTGALQGLPQFESLSLLQNSEIKFLDTLKRGPAYSLLTQQLKGLLSRDAGLAFQKWLKNNVLKRVVAENVSVSTTSGHNVDFELDNAFVEAKNALTIDAVQLAKIAEKAKAVGKDFWYVFLKKPAKSVINKIENQGGKVGWFLDDTD